VDSVLSEKFTLYKPKKTLKSVKPRKAAGYEGIKSKWIVTFLNNFLATTKLIQFFKQAKVISILNLYQPQRHLQTYY
jgi:hypothetical protein